MNKNNNALALAEYTLEGGQVLTADTVKNYLTSGNGAVTEQETLMFIELCKAQKLNPFIREAYLIKFGNSPANIVVGKDVFVKRAYRNPNFEGMKAGIVVVGKDGLIEEREGSLKLKGEELVGGWCEVYTNDKKFPIKSVVSLEEYSKSQSTWKTMPCVMIRKCAMVTALREAFPEDLQGLYDASEVGIDAKLPEKEIIPGTASPKQKNMILALAAQKDLFSFDTKKDTSKLEEFCDSNGYNLKELTFEEAEEVLDIIAKYEPKKHEEVQDVEFTEVTESEDNIDGQISIS
ncbi:phage recombination protein Bet [Terrisporobacter hibernicus]|uniref:Phage recombination protein Bet n=1 Tax=Terrisporobacter hibernicus TaxID=2813371 RepID=A0AAX2ZI93_9FIRM|nr:phage recombination protein Bet [Terrisporobacter hibernicus]UEL48102.1 phage recombination protein Bet [Terrisporobacter hibernicus]